VAVNGTFTHFVNGQKESNKNTYHSSKQGHASPFMKTLIAFTALLLLAPLALALSPVNKSKLSSLAIQGYDPVSYFTDAKATKGQKTFEYEYQGAKWRFSSKQNLDQFKADPEAYAPQFGGYCAWAVSQGYTANIDPKAWKVLEGKLYLNYNQSVQAKWEKDAETLIVKGNENWPKLLEE